MMTVCVNANRWLQLHGLSHLAGIEDVNGFRLATSPRSGIQLGSVAIFVSGPSFAMEDQITCIFQGFIQSEAMYVNATHVVCISPTFPITGQLRLQLQVNEVILEQEGVFILCK